MRRVVVTGIGAVTPVGNDMKQFGIQPYKRNLRY